MKVNILTPKQKEILYFIDNFIRNNEYAPSLEEIAKNFHLNSIATVHQHIEALRSKGFLKKETGRPRAISPLEEKTDVIEIPLIGRIAAGQPILAVEDPELIKIQKSLLSKSGRHFALKVVGDSMVEEGIFDGDIVVIKEQQTAQDGDTIVAVINEDEATLKKLYRENGGFRLQPANPTLFPIFTKELQIRGKVISVIRKFDQTPKKHPFKLTRRFDYTWDYKGSNTKQYTHGFHTYPAMFIPQIAHRLILNHSQPKDTIADIFCGSGTALVESRLLDRNSIGIDLNPLAIFLAKVKTTPIDPKLLQRTYFNLNDRINSINKSEITIPDFFNLNYWFKEEVIYQLAKIKKAILEIRDQKLKDFFLASFSEIVRQGSNMKGGEFKLVRINKEKLMNYSPNVISLFKQKVETNIEGMRQFSQDYVKYTKIKIILGDSSEDNGIKKESVSCIITSPPYGDSRTTVAYGQFSRLSMQWINLINDGELQLDNKLLGGKPSKSFDVPLRSSHLVDTIEKIKKIDEARAKDVLSFYVDLEPCLIQAHRILKQNGHLCIVIGNRTVKKVKLPTDLIIGEMCLNIGFQVKDIIVRNIPNKRMPLKNSPNNIVGELESTMREESIVILYKT